MPLGAELPRPPTRGCDIENRARCALDARTRVNPLVGYTNMKWHRAPWSTEPTGPGAQTRCHCAPCAQTPQHVTCQQLHSVIFVFDVEIKLEMLIPSPILKMDGRNKNGAIHACKYLNARHAMHSDRPFAVHFLHRFLSFRTVSKPVSVPAQII